MEQSLFNYWKTFPNGKETLPLSHQDTEIVIRECVDRRQLEYYTWFCITYYDILSYTDFTYVVRSALVDYIVVLEDKVVTGEDYWGFVDMLRNTPVGAEEVEFYVTWLISQGIIQTLEPLVIESLVLPLLRRNTSVSSSTLRSMMYCMLLAPENLYSGHLMNLLNICQENKSSQLLSMMSEAGLFSTAAGMKIFMNIGEIITDKEVLESATPYSVPRRPNLRFLLDTVARSVPLTKNYLDEIDSDVTPFLMVILTRLMTGHKDQVLPTPPETFLFTSRLTVELIKSPLSNSIVDSDLTLNSLTMLIACHGKSEAMQELDNKITRMFPARYTEYTAALNEALAAVYDEAQTVENRHILSWRYNFLVKLLGHELYIDEDSPHLGMMKISPSIDIGKNIISEISYRIDQSPDSESLMNSLKLADSYLALIVENVDTLRIDEARSIILSNYELVGDKTIIEILQSDRFLNTELRTAYKIKFQKYIFDNLETYIRTVIVHFLKPFFTASRNEIFRLGESIDVRCINDTLILGELHAYTRGANGNLQTEDIYEPRCAKCDSRFIYNIFTSPKDSHGVFYCQDCAETLEEAVSVTCIVCRGDGEDGLVWRIPRCKHVCCVECYRHLTACPACRYDLSTVNYRTVTIADAIEQYVSNY